jgi:acyl carrier protein
MPHADSIRMMEVMDEIRAKLGVVYPFEQKKA